MFGGDTEVKVCLPRLSQISPGDDECGSGMFQTERANASKKLGVQRSFMGFDTQQAG